MEQYYCDVSDKEMNLRAERMVAYLSGQIASQLESQVPGCLETIAQTNAVFAIIASGKDEAENLVPTLRNLTTLESGEYDSYHNEIRRPVFIVFVNTQHTNEDLTTQTIDPASDLMQDNNIWIVSHKFKPSDSQKINMGVLREIISKVAKRLRQRAKYSGCRLNKDSLLVSFDADLENQSGLAAIQPDFISTALKLFGNRELIALAGEPQLRFTSDPLQNIAILSYDSTHLSQTPMYEMGYEFSFKKARVSPSENCTVFRLEDYCRSDGYLHGNLGYGKKACGAENMSLLPAMVNWRDPYDRSDLIRLDSGLSFYTSDRRIVSWFHYMVSQDEFITKHDNPWHSWKSTGDTLRSNISDYTINECNLKYFMWQILRNYLLNNMFKVIGEYNSLIDIANYSQSDDYKSAFVSCVLNHLAQSVEYLAKTTSNSVIGIRYDDNQLYNYLLQRNNVKFPFLIEFDQLISNHNFPSSQGGKILANMICELLYKYSSAISDYTDTGKVCPFFGNLGLEFFIKHPS